MNHIVIVNFYISIPTSIILVVCSGSLVSVIACVMNWASAWKRWLSQ